MKTEADGLFSVNRDSKTVDALHLDGIKANLAGVMGSLKWSFLPLQPCCSFGTELASDGWCFWPWS